MQPLNLSAFPHWSQWFGVWAMAEDRFSAELEAMRLLNLHVHLSSGEIQAAQNRADDYQQQMMELAGKNKDIGVLWLSGKMMKHEASMSQGTSTVLARRLVAQAARDPAVSAIVLLIDSPGGQAAGTAELADAVHAAAQVKPVHAYIEDLGASAAYWVASQASSVSTNATGIVGSIGTYGIVYDTSGRAAMEGVKAHVVRAGKFKGTGSPGTEVTPEQLAEMQKQIEAINEHFVDGFSRGRKMNRETAEALADGRVYVGKQAQQAGLVDHVESFDAAFARLEAIVEKKKRSGRMDQTTTNQGPKAATIQELRIACLNATAEFLVKQLESEATVAGAMAAWMAEQQKQIEQLAAKVAKPGVAAMAEQPTSKSPGVANASGEFWSRVSELTKAGKSKAMAISAVAIADPALHQAMIAEANSKS